MLDSLCGTLISLDDDVAVLDVKGIRFRVDIPNSTANSLTLNQENTVLLTRMSFNPNEGSFNLFGFSTEVERECFDIFTKISGIGPRKGLMILSQIDIALFAKAIINNDLTYLSKLKGVGKKTAERLIVELREKMVPYTGGLQTGPGESSLPQAENVRDAVEALVALGCRQSVAEKAIATSIEILGPATTTQNLVREGLKHR